MSGLIGSMLAGAAEKVGTGLGNMGMASMLKDQEAQIQLDRDARLAEMKVKSEVEIARQKAPIEQATHAANAVVDTEGKIRAAKESPRTIAAGATEKIGDSTYTAPEKPGSENYYNALAKRWNAEADAITEGMKYKGKTEKLVMPNIKVEKDGDGNPYMIDQNSGAIGVIRPGEPAKSGVAHWFKPDEPATKAGAPMIDWNLNGKPVQLESLYPAITGRIGDKIGGNAEGSAVPGFKVYPQDIEAAKKDPAAYTKLAGIVGGKDSLDTIIADYDKTATTKPQPKPGIIQSRAVEQQTVSALPDAEGGAKVDAARAALNAAKSKVQSFGLTQRRKNPDGWESAQREARDAQQVFDSALAAYQQGNTELQSAARFKTR